MLKKLIITGICLFFTVAFVKPAFAVTTPEFNSCLNPQVSASQVNYGNNHGIVGDRNTYAGIDKIYSLQKGNILQCLCKENGDGIQTNWLKTTGMSQKDIDILKHDGWIFVITGSSWGLDDVAHLAKNISYSCKAVNPTPTCTPTPGPTATPTPTPKDEPKVLGLAQTGNSIAIYGLILAGTVVSAAGLFLRKVTK